MKIRIYKVYTTQRTSYDDENKSRFYIAQLAYDFKGIKMKKRKYASSVLIQWTKYCYYSFKNIE